MKMRKTCWGIRQVSKNHVMWLAGESKRIRTFARLAWCSGAQGRTGAPRLSQGSGGWRSPRRGRRGPVEGRGKCRAILSRSSVAPLDVLMHVENNLTANLLHSFSFLFRTFRPASTAHLPDPSFCTLSDERRERALLSVRRAAHLAPRHPFSAPRAACASAAPLAPNRIHNLNFWVIRWERGEKRSGTGAYAGGRWEERVGEGQTCRAINLWTLWGFGGAAGARDYGMPISRSVPYGSSLWRSDLAFYTWNDPAGGDHFYAGDIIRGLDGQDRCPESAGRDWRRIDRSSRNQFRAGELGTYIYSVKEVKRNKKGRTRNDVVLIFFLVNVLFLSRLDVYLSDCELQDLEDLRAVPNSQRFSSF